MKVEKTFFSVLLLCLSNLAWSQTYTQIQPQQADGFPIFKVSIILMNDSSKSAIEMNDSAEMKRFYKAFGIQPGAIFNEFIMDAAIKRIVKEPNVKSVDLELYNSQFSSSVWIKLIVAIQDTIKKAEVIGKKSGMLTKEGLKDFPVIYENDRSKLTFILNGSSGIFNEENAFLSEGSAFTQGNPIANDPAGRGVRFWGEADLEAGIGGIVQLGKSNAYLYGAASVLTSGRNTSDIYSGSSTIFTDFERLYGGLFLARLGKKENITIDLSAGRNFFQLNDGFLISRISGSANAGPRGNVYLSSRKAFEKTILATVQYPSLLFSFFFLEPDELSNENQLNVNITGASLDWNNDSDYQIGVAYLGITGGSATYSTPEGKINKKGMYIVNPKIWLNSIAGTGLFFKSEYAYQSHYNADMRSNGWYAGLGYEAKWNWTPSIYYRYAFLSGDNPSTVTYERFDPLLTGGLGDWIQGINYRKLLGNGNIISHRVQLQAYIDKRADLSLDYFALTADYLNNQGGLAPISTLKSLNLGQELTFSFRYYINKNYMLLGIFSHAFRGQAMNDAFSNPIFDWTSYQLAIFMFY